MQLMVFLVVATGVLVFVSIHWLVVFESVVNNDENSKLRGRHSFHNVQDIGFASAKLLKSYLCFAWVGGFTDFQW